jgi:hypothetical protein
MGFSGTKSIEQIFEVGGDAARGAQQRQDSKVALTFEPQDK